MMRLPHVLPIVCVLALAPLGALAEQPQKPQSGPVKVTPVIKTDRTVAGQPIVFPQKDGEVTVTTYEFPPGADLPIHKHPHLRIGYVLSGTLEVVDDESGKIDTFKPGQVLIESIDRWHHGRNRGDAPVKLVVVDLTPKGAEATVAKK